MVIESKKCSNCGIVKSAANFWKTKRGSNGLYSRCIQCGKIYNKDRYRLYRRDRNDAQIKKMGTYRPIVFSHYGNKCACCGETTPEFLTIDHVNNDGPDDIMPSGHRYKGGALYRKIIKESFPKRYQLLCMNCNFGKRMNNGFCPHVAIDFGR